MNRTAQQDLELLDRYVQHEETRPGRGGFTIMPVQQRVCFDVMAADLPLARKEISRKEDRGFTYGSSISSGVWPEWVIWEVEELIIDREDGSEPATLRELRELMDRLERVPPDVLIEME